MGYESKTEEPIVVTPTKELSVKEFNKKEVEQIAKSVCEPRFDFDNPFKGVEIVDANSTDEFFAAIDEGKLPLSSKSDLTDEQLEKILTILKKAINGKVVSRNGSAFLFLSYFEVSGSTSLCCCFGCSSSHEGLGLHIEYYLDLAEGSYTCNSTEI